MERDWFKRKDRFTGLIHGHNIVLEPLRGGVGTKLASSRVLVSLIDQECAGANTGVEIAIA